MRRLHWLALILVAACVPYPVQQQPYDPFATRAVAQQQQAGADAAIQATQMSYSQTQSAIENQKAQATMSADKTQAAVGAVITQQFVSRQGTQNALDLLASQASATDRAAQATRQVEKENQDATDTAAANQSTQKAQIDAQGTAQANSAMIAEAERVRLQIDTERRLQKEQDWNLFWRPFFQWVGVGIVIVISGAFAWGFYSVVKLLAVWVDAYIDQRRAQNLEYYKQVTPHGTYFWLETDEGLRLIPAGDTPFRLPAGQAARLAVDEVRKVTPSGSVLESPVRHRLTVEDLQRLAIHVLRQAKPDGNIIPGHREANIGGETWNRVVRSLEQAQAAYTVPNEATYVTDVYKTAGNLLDHLTSGDLVLAPLPREDGSESG